MDSVTPVAVGTPDGRQLRHPRPCPDASAEAWERMVEGEIGVDCSLAASCQTWRQPSLRRTTGSTSPGMGPFTVLGCKVVDGKLVAKTLEEMPSECRRSMTIRNVVESPRPLDTKRSAAEH